jgi:hypothetical protein
MKFIFVCHDDNSIRTVLPYLEKYSNVFIIFVGDKSTEYESNERILIARKFSDNIEHKKKLLTFTAWYLIIQNNLFPDEDSLCILEYDVTFDDTFYQELMNVYHQYDIISFWQISDGSFYNDTNKEVFDKYLKTHNLESITTWWQSTNHCIKRSVLHEFVNFYAFTVDDIQDETNLSFYHERVFSSYTNKNSRYVLNGMKHNGLYSHHYFRFKNYVMCYDDNKEKTDILIEDINKYSPETEVIRFNINDTHGYGLCWKPKMIYELLKNTEPDSTLLYISNNHTFDEKYYEYYFDYSFFKVWKKSNENLNDIAFILKHYKMNINPAFIEIPITDLFLFDNKKEILSILTTWIEMCKDFSNTKFRIQNYEDIILGIIIFVIKNKN